MFSPLRFEIKCFITLVEKENVSKAAQFLGMTQPQLSKILRSLEQEVGGSLFERTNRGLIITEAGREIYEQLSSLQAYWSQNLNAHTLSTPFRIGAHPLIGKFYIPLIVDRAQKEFPFLNISYLDKSSKEIGHLVASRDLELGIAANPTPLKGLIMHEITKDDVGIFAAGANSDILVVNPQLIHYSRLLKRSKYKHTLEIENYDVAALTAEKLGCHIILPGPATHNYKLRKLKTLDSISIKLVYSEHRRHQPMIEMCKSVLKKK